MATVAEILDAVAEPHSRAYWEWNEVNVDYVQSLLRDPEGFADALPSGDANLIRAMAARFGLEVGDQSAEDLMTALYVRFESGDAALLTEFAYLRWFCRHTRSEAVANAAVCALGADRVQEVADLDLPGPEEKYLLAALVLVNTPERLRLIKLYDSLVRSSFSRYVLGLDPDEANGLTVAERQRASAAIAEGLSPDAIDEQLIGDYVEAFEGELRERRRSRCVGAAYHPDDGQVDVFVLREEGPSMIRGVENNRFGVDSEVMVARLSDRLRVLDQKSSRDSAVKLLSLVVSGLTGLPLAYLPAIHVTSGENLAGFLRAIAHDEVPHFTLLELRLNEAPIDGSPELLVRNEDPAEMRKAIAGLDQLQVDLLAFISDIRSVRVMFQSEEDWDDTSHQFRLNISPAGNREGFFVGYYSRTQPRKKRLFERCIWEEHNVVAIPRSGSDGA